MLIFSNSWIKGKRWRSLNYIKLKNKKEWKITKIHRKLRKNDKKQVNTAKKHPKTAKTRKIGPRSLVKASFDRKVHNNGWKTGKNRTNSTKNKK